MRRRRRSPRSRSYGELRRLIPDIRITGDFTAIFRAAIDRLQCDFYAANGRVMAVFTVVSTGG